MFARKGIVVAVASRHQPEALAPQENVIGPTIVPKALKDALEADIVILAVPYLAAPRGREGTGKLEGQDP